MLSPATNDPAGAANGVEEGGAPTSHKAITFLPIQTGTVKVIKLTTISDMKRAIISPAKIRLSYYY